MVDGLKLYLQQAGNSVIQSCFYNGWKHDHFVTNIFAFALNGSIITCTLNAPGTWHDSTLEHWGSMYSKLQKCWEDHHGKVLMDSVFASNMYKFIIQSSQNVPLTSGNATWATANVMSTSSRMGYVRTSRIVPKVEGLYYI